MNEGFFSRAALPMAKEPPSLIAKCGTCGLYKGCQSPKMPVSGKGRRRILIVGEAPGENEDAQGKQFVGDSGQRLRSALRKFGIDPNEDCWFTNALSCRPPRNRTPTEKEINYCRPLVVKAINELKPNVIIPLGGSAVRSVIAHAWRDDIDAITRWVGWGIPSQKLNAWICPSYHPSYLLRMNDPVLDRDFETHIAAAVKITKPPWRALHAVPDYKNDVDIEMDDKRIAKWLRVIKRKGLEFSWDIETDRLKPDDKDATIICCSVCAYHHDCRAFPWHGKVIPAMKQLLQSDNPKYGYNCKFESRWAKRLLGVDVKNWVWDGMIAAHVLDNRASITSLKFQSFVLLGQGDYDSHIKPYLEGTGGNGRNRIRELDLSALMLYCGMDSLMEYKIAIKQMEMMKHGGICL